MSPAFTDLTVRTGDPDLLAETLAQLPGHASVVQGESWNASAQTVQVRVYDGLGFVKFALVSQGYGEEKTYPDTSER